MNPISPFRVDSLLVNENKKINLKEIGIKKRVKTKHDFGACWCKCIICCVLYIVRSLCVSTITLDREVESSTRIDWH